MTTDVIQTERDAFAERVLDAVGSVIDVYSI